MRQQLHCDALSLKKDGFGEDAKVGESIGRGGAAGGPVHECIID